MKYSFPWKKGFPTPEAGSVGQARPAGNGQRRRCL
jgi:hypothetical protein